MNPAIDDCEQHFLYDWSETDGLFVKIYAKDIEGRGKKTINILDLNRLDLLLERSSHIKYILKPIAIGLHVSRDQSGLEEKKQENIAKLKEVISPESQFSGLAKYYSKLFHLSEYF